MCKLRLGGHHTVNSWFLDVSRCTAILLEGSISTSDTRTRRLQFYQTEAYNKDRIRIETKREVIREGTKTTDGKRYGDTERLFLGLALKEIRHLIVHFLFEKGFDDGLFQ